MKSDSLFPMMQNLDLICCFCAGLYYSVEDRSRRWRKYASTIVDFLISIFF